MTYRKKYYISKIFYMKRVSDLLNCIFDIAPLNRQESYDNSGLIIGDPNMIVDKVLITLDVTEDVIDEAISKSCHFIISHHPLIFNGLKRITPSSPISRTVIKAIKHDIAIAAMHTNLDNSSLGVNHRLATKLGLKDLQILRPVSGKMFKIMAHCADSIFEEVKKIFEDTRVCDEQQGVVFSYNADNAGGLYKTLELVTSEESLAAIMSALKHYPSTSLRCETTSVLNKNENVGGGMVGVLDESMKECDFLAMLKDKLNAKALRHSSFLNKPIKKVALCGGSGFFMLPDAKSCNADVYVTADVKYHDFFDADGRILLVDAGHFETEQYAKEIIADYIIKKNSNFAVLISEVNTNSINYFV